ncbi:hypothetical protein BH10BAC3_BH10BAC3_11780 [soil metagenome]
MVNTVLDTPDEIIMLQRNIILSKPVKERAAMGIDMINSVYTAVKNSISKAYPNATNGELVAMTFERYYSNDFTAEKLSEIKQAIIAFHNKSNNESSI